MLHICGGNSLPCLQGLRCLQELHIRDVGALADLDGMGSCSQLLRLCISSCDRLTDIARLTGCGRLQELTISGADRLADISGIAS